MRRAITLAGGGPAAGLHIGALQALEKKGIDFHVWALSCIGAWVGIIYNQFEGERKADKTLDLFRRTIFREDKSYYNFPVNSVFGPDMYAYTKAMVSFLLNPNYYKHVVLPEEIIAAARENLEFLFRFPNWNWNSGNFHNWLLNRVLAVHPASRFVTSLAYLSPVNGLVKVYYPGSNFLKSIDFGSLFADKKPWIYHNAWNLNEKKLDLFANMKDEQMLQRGKEKNRNYKKITEQSLCACSALPYVEETLEIDGNNYCEGALVDTVNFRQLLEDHGEELDEVWVSRIVDVNQVQAPENIKDALGNLCMLFAAAVGEDDVRLFRVHAQRSGWRGKIIEIKPSAGISYDWSHSNLEAGRREGSSAVDAVFDSFEKAKQIARTAAGPLQDFHILDPEKTPHHLKSFMTTWRAKDEVGGISILPKRDGENGKVIIANLIASDLYAGKGDFSSTKPKEVDEVWSASTSWLEQDEGGKDKRHTHYIVTKQKDGGHIAFALANKNAPAEPPSQAVIDQVVRRLASAEPW